MGEQLGGGAGGEGSAAATEGGMRARVAQQTQDGVIDVQMTPARLGKVGVGHGPPGPASESGRARWDHVSRQ
jgi:hypothetical protein